jgi:glycine oxidase
VLIVGGGLAGTALAWSLHQRSRTFLLVDEVNTESASRVAAGLVTPITGKRLTETYQWSSAFPISDQLYRYAESILNEQFWFRTGAWRLLNEAEEVKHHLQHDEASTIDVAELDFINQSRRNGFWMSESHRLDVPHYLKASHRYFESMGCLRNCTIELANDLKHDKDSDSVCWQDIRASYAISCRGIVDANDTMFDQARFNPAQGDILQIEFEQPLRSTTLHFGKWLTPSSAVDLIASQGTTKRWLLGATHQWRPLDGKPSPKGRDDLLHELSNLIKIDVKVLDHRAAVRPTSFDQKPFVGMHSMFQRLGLINGLGTKGCYLAPWCATLLIDHFFEQKRLPAELRWNR